MTTRELLDEAIAWGSGTKSTRNQYSGWMSSDTWHQEQRNAAIAQTDAAIAAGFFTAAQAQYMKDQLELDGTL